MSIICLSRLIIQWQVSISAISTSFTFNVHLIRMWMEGIVHLCPQNLKHLLKTNLHLTAWWRSHCDDIARCLDVVFLGRTEEKEKTAAGRQRDENRSFKTDKRKTTIQTLICLEQCDTATRFPPSGGNIETFYTSVIFWLFSAVRDARCSAAVWGELYPLNCSDGHMDGAGEQRSAALCGVCETFNTCTLTHTHEHNYITWWPSQAGSSHSGFVATLILSLM